MTDWTDPRTGLRVRKPLQRRTGLRRAPLEAPTVAGRKTVRLRVAERAFEQAKKAVRRRSRGLCERCGWQRAAQFHHRLPRRMGGSSRNLRVHSPANILHLCSACHETVEAFRERAHTLGLLLHAGQDPAQTPVTLGTEPFTRRVLLTEDGEVWKA